MFDAITERLLRTAPRLQGIDPERIPQQISEDFTALVLASADPQGPDRSERIARLHRLATTYEALADLGTSGETRRASAFVAGTAHRILQSLERDESVVVEQRLLTKGGISSKISAPLLFLISGQFPDAKEIARALAVRWQGNLIRVALAESVYDLSTENLRAIVDRAERLRAVQLPESDDIEDDAATALFAMCWHGMVLLSAQLLDVPPPRFRVFSFDAAEEAFDRVLQLAAIPLDVAGASDYISTYSGPRHLARLLRTLATDLPPTAVTRLPSPHQSDPVRWERWLRHRAVTKPILWPNHRSAVKLGFHEPGRSAVLVLPTGAGKTTLAEVKIAASIAAGRSVVFLVPTLALVDQLSRDLTESFPPAIIEQDLTSFGFEAVEFGKVFPTIRVMTPEKCLTTQSFQPESFSDVGLLVLDECHILNDSGRRGLDAMLALLETMRLAPEADMLLLSAMVENANELAEWLATETKRPCETIINDWLPSRQARGVVIYAKADMERAIRNARNVWGSGAMPNKAAEAALAASPFGLFGLSKNWQEEPTTNTHVLPLTPRQVHISGKKLRFGIVANSNRNEVSAELASSLTNAGLKTLIFVRQPTWAQATAEKVHELLDPDEEIQLTEREEQLRQAIDIELGGSRYSRVCRPYSVVVHHADLILRERQLSESLFRRVDAAKVIVATPTLSQGMNLPVEAVIIAGDDRHDPAKNQTKSLETHEILNAAGRAGRAGHLANGFVLLVPSDVITFQSSTKARDAEEKLATLLPATDRCVTVVDPLAKILDRIQASPSIDQNTGYLLERIGFAANGETADTTASRVLRRSFGGFLAKRRGEQISYESKIAAFAQLALKLPAAEPDIGEEVSARTGLPREAVNALVKRLKSAQDKWPTSIPGWVDWLFGQLVADRPLLERLIGQDEEQHLLAITRTKSTEPAPFPHEIARLKEGIHLWISGAPLAKIEMALSPTSKIQDALSRARELANVLAPRTLAFLFGILASLTKSIAQRLGLSIPSPASVDCLHTAIQKGFDRPSKILFAERHPELLSRVQIHQRYQFVVGTQDMGDDVHDIAAIRAGLAAIEGT